MNLKLAETILKDAKPEIKIVNPTPEMEELLKLREVGVKIRIEKRENERPTILIEGSQIAYNAVPLKNEFEPFLKTLLRVWKKESGLKNEVVREIQGVSAKIDVYVTQFCPNCAKVVEKVTKFAIANPKIAVRIVDATLFPSNDVTSVPTVVINNKLKLVGDISETELAEWIVEASKKAERGQIAILLKEGKLEEAIKVARENAELFAEVLERPELMARIGAMVALEKLHKEGIDLSRAKIKLIQIIEKDDPVKSQDAAFILGKIGEKDDITILEKLLDNSRDIGVKEAIMEAIDEIRKRAEGLFN